MENPQEEVWDEPNFRSFSFRKYKKKTYFLTTSFQPSSLLPPCFGLVEDTIEFFPAHEPEFESPSQ
jgi:hypothetical protein